MMKLLIVPFAFSIVGCISGPGPVIPENRTERQMLGLLEKFDRWDDDGNGELTVQEVDHGINRLKGTPMKVNYTGKQVIKFYDSNRNSTVSLREAQAGYRRADEVEGQLSQ